MTTQKYNSISPVLRYDTGLRYGQLLNGGIMPRAKSGLSLLTIAGLMQYLQNLITAATGNPNVPTPTPTLPAMQALLDDGATKIDAVAAAADQLRMLRADRDAHMELIRAAITQFIAHSEAACGFNAVKLQSLGLTLRNPPSPASPCSTVMGLVARVGDDEGHLLAEWDKDPFADAYEVQTSPDPITSAGWTHAISVSEPKVRVTDLASGHKRWIRSRGINRLGPGSWSDPACRMIP